MSLFGMIGGPLGGFLGSSPISGLGGGSPLSGLLSGAAGSTAGIVLRKISSWVLGGTRDAIEQVASAIGAVTAPNLDSTWFSSTYWRVAALAAMLTIPFLCAAAVQAVARADLSLLARVAFGYLPLSVLGVSLAAPLTMLALAATDQMSAAVSASAATGGARFLDHAAAVAGGLAAASGESPFFAVVVGLLAVMAALALAIELLVRAAAVYVVVLMLPLAFAALVWPARRMWAVRLVELLASLILSKFVIVAVLSLAGEAFAGGTSGVGQLLVAMALILLSTFAPWALMRILPFTELAAGAAGIIGNELPRTRGHTAAAQGSMAAGALAADLPARLRNQARLMYAGTGGESEPGATAAAAASSFDEPLEGDASASPSSTEPAGSSPAAPAPESAAPTPPVDAGARAEPADDDLPFIMPRGPVRLDNQLLRGPSLPQDPLQGPRDPVPQDLVQGPHHPSQSPAGGQL